jgi:hypothetical protein
MILPAAALAICLALPQISQATNVQNDVAVTQQKEVKYTEITADQIPEAVSTTLAKDYNGFKTDNVFLGDDGTYKLVVSKGTDKSVLFFSGKGELIKAEKASDKANSEKANPEKPMK